MKKLTFFLLSLIALTVNAQYTPQYTLETHPMYSDIWVMSHKDGVNHLNAKYGYFTFDTYKVKNVFENIDPDKVKSLLLESYNQFRQDYGVNPISEEDKKMSEEASQYGKTLYGSILKHSDSNNQYNECIVYLPFMLLTNVEIDNVDLNKLVAECYFDLFVGCPAHMAILLKDDITTAGFGIDMTNMGILVCIRSK